MFDLLSRPRPSMRHRGPMGGGGWSPNPDDNPTSASGGRTFSFLSAPTTLRGRMMGTAALTDGRRIRTWYFGNGFNGDRTVPSPVIECTQGETARITLVSMMPHSIHLHGLDVDQANDGVPSTSGYVGRSMGRGPMADFGRVSGAQSLGRSYTYSFTAPHAGTYMYHCHVDTVLHFEMGMYGTVIVRPPGGLTDRAWSDGPRFDKEYIWHLHTFDSSWHQSRVSGATTTRHNPDCFLLNGRDGADALADPTSAILAGPGQRVLIRATGVGYQPARLRLGGLPFSVIASDGRPLPEAIRTDTWMLAPGERYDLLLEMPASGEYTAAIDYHDIRGRRVLGSVATRIRVT